MTRIERLKELSKGDGRREGENLGEFCDRWHSEDREIRNALPLLLEVAEALKEVNDYLGEGCPISQIISRFADDFVASGSQNGLVEKGEVLQAALAKLEAAHED